jgi:hypothetical protein
VSIRNTARLASRASALRATAAAAAADLRGSWLVSSVQCDALSLVGNLPQTTAAENSAPLTVLPLGQNCLNLSLLLLVSRLWWTWHI